MSDKAPTEAVSAKTQRKRSCRRDGGVMVGERASEHRHGGARVHLTGSADGFDSHGTVRGRKSANGKAGVSTACIGRGQQLGA